MIVGASKVLDETRMIRDGYERTFAGLKVDIKEVIKGNKCGATAEGITDYMEEMLNERMEMDECNDDDLVFQ